MKKLRMVLTVGLLSIVLSACATIMRDNSQTIPITSSTDNVDIRIADKIGKVIFEGQTIIDWHVSAWYWAGNMALWGLIGYLIIDPITGDMYYLDEDVHLNMTPIKK